MTSIINRLKTNLDGQLQAMIQDDVTSILKFVEEQELLNLELQDFLAHKPALSVDDLDKLREVSELVLSNQLLSQQSLSFSRRMLKLLGGDESYGERGSVSSTRVQSLRVDIRA